VQSCNKKKNTIVHASEEVMTLGRFSLITTVLLSCGAVVSAGPQTHILDTNSYNFQLNGGGGGAQATLDKTQSIDFLCGLCERHLCSDAELFRVFDHNHQ